MTSASRDLLVEQRAPVATITFNRPHVRNAITRAMWEQMQAALAELGNNAAVRVVIFRGAGDEAFSAGADISEFEQTRATPEGAYQAFRLIEETLQQIEALPQATLAVIKGFAVGAGCELANACDLRIAARESRIGIPAARRGITIGHSHIRRLVRLVGPARAKVLLLTGHLYSGQEAFEAGLVDYVAPLAEVDALTDSVASQIVESGPRAIQWAKAAIHRILDDPALASLEDDAAVSTAYAATAEFAEGVRAFREKRSPRF